MWQRYKYKYDNRISWQHSQYHRRQVKKIRKNSIANFKFRKKSLQRIIREHLMKVEERFSDEDLLKSYNEEPSFESWL